MGGVAALSLAALLLQHLPPDGGSQLQERQQRMELLSRTVRDTVMVGVSTAMVLVAYFLVLDGKDGLEGVWL